MRDFGNGVWLAFSEDCKRIVLTLNGNVKRTFSRIGEETFFEMEWRATRAAYAYAAEVEKSLREGIGPK